MKSLNRIPYWIFAIVILYASYLLILLSLPYVVMQPNIDFLKTKQLIYHIDIWRISFYTHVFSSPIIIISGLLQFNHYIIHRKKKLHRILGYAYVITILFISGPSALIMGAYANGGYATQISFVILASVWIISTALSVYYIRKVELATHLNWMLRSYALTLSAVTLRFYAYLFDVVNLNLPPKETYILLSYISWIPNLIVVELLIRFKKFNRLLIP